MKKRMFVNERIDFSMKTMIFSMEKSNIDFLNEQIDFFIEKIDFRPRSTSRQGASPLQSGPATVSGDLVRKEAKAHASPGAQAH